MNKNDKITKMPQKAAEPMAPELPELYTDPEIAEYGEVLSTTPLGAIFVKKDDTIYLFTPCARTHSDKDNFYYQRMDFR